MIPITGRFVSVMKTLLKTVTACLFSLLSLPATSQVAVLSSAGDAWGSGGTSSFSVGQTAFSLVTGNSGTVTEGVQQPYEILFMDGIGDPGFKLDSRVYPNPAVTRVILSVDQADVTRYRYEMRDAVGVLLEQSALTAKETAIPVAGLPAGTYLLTVLERNRNLATWKVIKK
ncbi:MAG TPA: T9SS type A sorting domain-containing protein [Bacteroidales bacterium]|nr:T9SS type A sorting domain-containing protein [Bacteroidales bacterium]